MTSLQYNRQLPNTLALPCAADTLCVSGIEQARDAVRLARALGRSLLPLGEGSNVVLPGALQGIALYVTDKSVHEVGRDNEFVTLRVGAGHAWHAFVCTTVAEGYVGLENLALIPGTVGAAPIQNIGAYGREVAAFIDAVHGVDLHSGDSRSLNAEQCEFSYRHSVFKGALRDRFLICAVDFRLSKHAALDTHYPALAAQLDGQAPLSAQQVLDAVVALRRQRLPDPELEPNVGSFFKNPVVDATWLRNVDGGTQMPQYPQPDGRIKLSAAWLIDHCGLKGLREGGACIASRHALVITNRGGATQRDVLTLAERVVHAVQQRYGLTLEMEPRVYGDG